MIYPEFNNIEIENCLGTYPVRESTKKTARPLTEIKFTSALEVGCGTGFITIYLRTLGFNCEGIDINGRAVDCAKQNAQRNNIEANFYVSDLFENVNKKFDLIIFNPPITVAKSRLLNKWLNLIKSVLPIRNPVIMRFYYLFFKSQRIHLIKHFLSEVSNYLEKSGKVLILLTPYEFALLKGIPFKIIVPAPSPNMNVVLMKF